jgi:hypothetical protein
MSILKNLLKNPASEAIKGAVEGVGNVVDKFVQSPDEKAKLKAELEKEISQRWGADMTSDSWLSKNVRPLVLIWAMVNFTLLMWLDGNVGEFSVNESWIPMFSNIMITIIGGYFVVRSIDKRGRVK